MAEPSRKEDVPALCKAYFVSLSRALMFIYIVGGIYLAGVGTAVAYALKNNTDVSELRAKTVANDAATDEINRKLDILINRGLTICK